MKKKLSSYLVVFVAFTLLALGSTAALTSTVTPAFARLSISSQTPQATANIAVTNNNDVALTYSVQIVDVDVLSGTLLPKNTISEVTKQLLQVQSNTLTIEPKKTAVVSVIARNFEQLAPGGHYASLKIEPIVAVQKYKNSNVQQAVSVPLFIVKEDGVLRRLDSKINFGSLIRVGSLPTAKITLKNTGNVDGVPRGFYSITRDTSTVTKVAFNETSVPLFANQEQTFVIRAPKKSTQFLGTYTAIVSYKIDGQDMPIIYIKKGWFMPWWSMAALLFGILVLICVIRYTLHKSKSKTLAAVAVVTAPKKRRSRKGAKYEAEKLKTAKKTVVSDFGSTKGVK